METTHARTHARTRDGRVVQTQTARRTTCKFYVKRKSIWTFSVLDTPRITEWRTHFLLWNDSLACSLSPLATRQRLDTAPTHGGHCLFFILNEQLFNGVLESLYLRFQLRAFVCGDGSCDDRSRDATRASERLLGRHEDVRHVLIFREQREVEEDFERFGVRRHDDELGDSAVERFGGFVRAFLQLLVRARGRDDVQDRHRQRRVGERVRLRVRVSHGFCAVFVRCVHRERKQKGTGQSGGARRVWYGWAVRT